MAFATGTSAERQVSPMMICPVLDEKVSACTKDCFVQPMTQRTTLLDAGHPIEQSSGMPGLPVC